MDLKEYVLKQKTGKGLYAAFASKIGISAQYLWIICHKKRMPSLDLAQKIVLETGCQVTFIDLLGYDVDPDDLPTKCPHCKRKYPKSLTKQGNL